MSNAITNKILAAAALAISLSHALAQTPAKLNAEIPFAFRIGNHVYEAGNYAADFLSTNSSSKLLRMVNKTTGGTSLALAIAPIPASNSTQSKAGTRLVFQCESSDCTLSQVWMSNGEPGVQFRTPKSKGAGPIRISTMRLLPTSAN